MKRLLLLSFLFLMPSAQAETYKLRLSGDWWSSSYTFLVVEVDGQTVKPRFVDHNNAFGTFKPAKSKWFDYPAVAIRACPLGTGSWGSSDECIVSESDSITLPEGTDLNEYRFDFKYEKSGATTEHSFKMQDLIQQEKEKSKKKERQKWSRDD